MNVSFFELASNSSFQISGKNLVAFLIGFGALRRYIENVGKRMNQKRKSTRKIQSRTFTLNIRQWFIRAESKDGKFFISHFPDVGVVETLSSFLGINR